MAKKAKYEIVSQGAINTEEIELRIPEPADAAGIPEEIPGDDWKKHDTTDHGANADYYNGVQEEQINASGFARGFDAGKKAAEQEQEPQAEPTGERESPLEVYSRLVENILRVANNNTNKHAKRHEAEQMEAGPLKLSDYPAHIAAIDIEILNIGDAAKHRLDAFAEDLKAIRWLVNSETDDRGKLIYSNEEKRAAEIERRENALEGYAKALIEQAALEGAKARLIIELQFINNQFTVAKEMQREATARLLAGVGTGDPEKLRQVEAILAQMRAEGKRPDSMARDLESMVESYNLAIGPDSRLPEMGKAILKGFFAGTVVNPRSNTSGSGN